MFYQTNMNNKIQQFYLFDFVSIHVVLHTVCFGGGREGGAFLVEAKISQKTILSSKSTQPQPSTLSVDTQARPADLGKTFWCQGWRRVGRNRCFEETRRRTWKVGNPRVKRHRKAKWSHLKVGSWIFLSHTRIAVLSNTFNIFISILWSKWDIQKCVRGQERWLRGRVESSRAAPLLWV